MNVMCPGCGKAVKLGASRACPKCGRPFTGAVGGSSISRHDDTEPREVPFIPGGGGRSSMSWLTDNSNLMMLGAVGLIGFMVLIGLVVLIASRPWDRSASAPPPPLPAPRVIVVAPAPVVPVAPVQPTTAVVQAPVAPFEFLLNLRPSKPKVDYKETVTDEKIGEVLDKSTDYLLSIFQNGKLKDADKMGEEYREGLHALAVYALLHAGTTVEDERLAPTGSGMSLMLEELKKLPLQTTRQTYARALRVAALCMTNRPSDRRTIEADVQYLLKSSVGGAFGYHMPGENATRDNSNWDNSNAQYGALGLWLASDAGYFVPKAFWRDVESHWTDTQSPDGTWGYTRGGGTLPMTAAGVNMLFVARSKLADEARLGKVGLPPYSQALAKGLAWLSSGDHLVNMGGAGHSRGYTIYGIERTALASGFRYFGKHDWYRALASQILIDQQKDGSWHGAGHPAIETAFNTLFLTRGRHSVAVSKLKYDGAWANRPDDAQHLVTFVGQQIERPLNWQVVGIEQDWQDWIETPTLLVSGHEFPRFVTDPKALEQLKHFVDAGGLIFSNADNKSPEFTQGMARLAKVLSGGEDMSPIARDHPIYKSLFDIRPEEEVPEVKPLLPSLKPATKPVEKTDGRPVLWGVSRGARLLLVHAPSDLSRLWQEVDENRGGSIIVGGRDVKAEARQKSQEQRQFSVEAAANVFIYAGGRRDYRNRLESPYVEAPPVDPTGEIPVARVRYEGQWNPEPQAWDRQSRWMQSRTNLRIKPVDVDLAALKFETAPVAHLTGRGPRRFDIEEVNALRNYVTRGGVLLIDSTGGDPVFSAAVRDGLLPSAFPQDTPARISKTHPLLKGDGSEFMPDLSDVLLNDFTGFARRDQDVRPLMFTSGRGAVVLSDLDLITGMVGGRTFGYEGYATAWTADFVNNVLLWMMTREELKLLPE